MSEQKVKILVADDDQVLLDMYKERLSLSGFEVITAMDGEEALNIAKKILPGVILLDVMMPKANGLDVLSTLKSIPETKHIPILILTALSQENYRQKGLSAGAADYIVKSETMPKDIVAKIKKAIKAN